MIVSYYFYQVPEKFLPLRIKPYYSLVARFFSLATLYSIRIKIITRGCVILYYYFYQVQKKILPQRIKHYYSLVAEDWFFSLARGRAHSSGFPLAKLAQQTKKKGIYNFTV